MNLDTADIKTHKEIIRQTPENSPEMVDLLNGLGRKLRLAGANLDEVSRIFSQARSISQKINYPDGEAIALCFWGILNISRQKKKEGFELFEAALKFSPAISPKNLGRIYCEYGFFLQNFGEFDRSFEHIQKALNIGLQLEDSDIQSYAYLSLARLCYFLNEIDDSITYTNKALTFENPKPSLSQMLDFLGYSYYMKSDYTQAIDCFNRALSERLDYDVQTLINLKCNLALSLQKVGSEKEAEAHIKAAMEILKDTGNLMNWAFFLNDAAEFYFNVGNFEKSISCREQVSQAALKDGNKDLYFLSEIHIAECLLELGDTFQTEEQLLIIVSKLEGYSEKDLPNINMLMHKCYSAFAKFYTGMGVVGEANKYFDEARHYKDLKTVAELNQKSKEITARIKIEEFKRIAFA